jgi:NAD(P)H-hydrate epimerase
MTLSLTIDQFREMDALAIQNYALPIELMMENAGLQLARLVSSYATREDEIWIGIGPGNNGGGGLVAARRLSGWGYQVKLDNPGKKLNPLPTLQLERALAAGAEISPLAKSDVFVDAYFGFSQKLPLPDVFLASIEKANLESVLRISLDLPSGFNKDNGNSNFRPELILTMAAPKTELIKFGYGPGLFIADIGIPGDLYEYFGIRQPDFSRSGIVRYTNL